MKVLVVKEGKFYSGGWKFNTDFAFTNEQDLHDYMEQVNGFKCELTVDAYSVKGTRFTNKEKEYGYDIVTLEVFEAPVEEVVTTKDLEDEIYEEETKEQITGVSDNAVRQRAKELGVKSWHLKSRENLVIEIAEILKNGGTSE